MTAGTTRPHGAVCDTRAACSTCLPATRSLLRVPRNAEVLPRVIDEVTCHYSSLSSETIPLTYKGPVQVTQRDLRKVQLAYLTPT